MYIESNGTFLAFSILKSENSLISHASLVSYAAGPTGKYFVRLTDVHEEFSEQGEISEKFLPFI